MYYFRVNVTSPRQISMHILMSLANELPCILVSLVLTEAVGIINFQLEQVLSSFKLECKLAWSACGRALVLRCHIGLN